MENYNDFINNSVKFNNMSEFEKKSAKNIIKSYKILDNFMNHLDFKDN